MYTYEKRGVYMKRELCAYGKRAVCIKRPFVRQTTKTCSSRDLPVHGKRAM